MNITSLKLVYFSPTQTTKKVVESIAQGFQVDTVEHLDLTSPETIKGGFAELHDELAIIGAPVYGGRVPIDAVHRLRQLKADDTPAVVVVVYGNRAYEDALLELKTLAEEAGFKPVAGGAFIGEHSFAHETLQIANGRPDTEDLKKARAFGAMIRKKLRGIRTRDDMPPIRVPGNFPYKERSKPSKESAGTRETLCTACGTCAAVCPTGAITVNDTVTTDPGACILCCACVKNCPTQARVMEEPRIKQLAERLSTDFRERKEPEMYLNS